MACSNLVAGRDWFAAADLAGVGGTRWPSDHLSPISPWGLLTTWLRLPHWVLPNMVSKNDNAHRAGEGKIHIGFCIQLWSVLPRASLLFFPLDLCLLYLTICYVWYLPNEESQPLSEPETTSIPNGTLVCTHQHQCSHHVIVSKSLSTCTLQIILLWVLCSLGLPISHIWICNYLQYTVETRE